MFSVVRLVTACLALTKSSLLGVIGINCQPMADTNITSPIRKNRCHFDFISPPLNRLLLLASDVKVTTVHCVPPLVRVEGWRRARRGKVRASRTSWPTLRIFFAKGSQASFWRISGFITPVTSIYAVGAHLPNTFCQGWSAAAVVRCAPCLWRGPRWRQWQ